ncbi:hypothetical protein [Methylobacterium sp. P5_C11]
MSRKHIGDYDLWNRNAQAFETASLFSEIAANNVQDFKNRWRPSFDKKREELKASGNYTGEGLRAAGIEDAHWDWPKKAELIEHSFLTGFAIECAGQTQGLMLAMPMGFAREESQAGRPLTEVLLLSAAPWNRPRFTDAPIYKGVGRILLTAAVSLSKHEEHGGRIGLHALAGAESWYRDQCGMTDLGFDEAKKMRYFEFTEAQALKFVT